MYKASIDQQYIYEIHSGFESSSGFPSLLCVILLYKSTTIGLLIQLFEMFPVTNDIVFNILFYLLVYICISFKYLPGEVIAGS